MDEFSFPTYDRPCPVCLAGPAQVAYLIVGEPAMSPEMDRAMKAGTISLAGCMPPLEDWRDSDEAWSCNRCGSEWVTRRGRKAPLIYSERGIHIGDN